MTGTNFEYTEEHCSSMVQHLRLLEFGTATGGILSCIINGIITSTVVSKELAAEINAFAAIHGNMRTTFSAERSLVEHINHCYKKYCQTNDKFPTDLFLDQLKIKYYIAKEIVDLHQLYQQQRKEMLTRITPTKVTAMIKCISPAGIERIVEFLDPASIMDINELFNQAYELAEVMLEYMPNEKVGLCSFITKESDFLYVHSV